MRARMQACAKACVAWPSQAVAQPGSSCEGVVKGFKTKSLAEGGKQAPGSKQLVSGELGANKALRVNSLLLESWEQTSSWE